MYSWQPKEERTRWLSAAAVCPVPRTADGAAVAHHEENIVFARLGRASAARAATGYPG
jgi:hypothetical protein